MKSFIEIVLNRRSVSMGDDAFDHERQLTIDRHATINQLAKRILKGGYLVKISGGKATWIMKINKQSIAVIAQQWRHPRFIISESLELVNFNTSDEKLEVYFDYLMQQEPDEVYELIKLDNK